MAKPYLQIMKKLLSLIFFILLAFNSFSQSVLIPYRVGKLWGLADTNAIVKYPPTFDEIEVQNIRPAGSKNIEPFYIVKKKGREGLMRGTKLLLPPKAERIFLDSVFIREFHSTDGQPMVGSSRQVIRNLNGKVLFRDSVMEIHEAQQYKGTHMLYYTFSPNNTSGAFWYDAEKQEIRQWLFKGAMSIGVRGDRGQNLYASVLYRETDGGAKKYRLTFNKSTNLFESKPSAIPSNLWDDDPQRYSGSSGFRDNVGNNLSRDSKFVKSASGDIIRILKESHYREGGSKSDTLKIQLDAESSIISDFSSGKFGPYHTSDMNFVAKTDTLYTYQNYVIYTKNEKKGIVVEKNIVPAVYNDLIYFVGYLKSKPLFLASKLDPITNTLKWGVIGSDGEEIQPPVYDQIIRSNGSNTRWILKKDNLYGITDRFGKTVFPPKFEKITATESFLDFSIYDKGKYGYIDSYGKYLLPTFPYRINRELSFGKYPIFELKDSKGAILGYANKKGLLFFKN